MIDPQDTHNLHLLVHRGQLNQLRRYAKIVLELADLRRPRTGRPVADSLPEVSFPRGGISMIAAPGTEPTAPPPQTVFCVTTDQALDNLHSIVTEICNNTQMLGETARRLAVAVEAVIEVQE